MTAIKYSGRRPHFAVFHTWPETKNAEYENIARLIDAAKLIEADLSIVDNNGYVLWSSRPNRAAEPFRLNYGDCDFAISLHFESPKTLDIYSYAAIWNPLDFYFAWGYEKSVDKFLTHDDLLSCGSDVAEAHALNILTAYGRQPPLPLPRLYHSFPGIESKPAIHANSRVFYVGINWERINNEKGRHHEVLLGLDRAGLIDIYGPELFQGVKPWEGYSGYRGSIPFDGKSLVRQIAKSGICLAFSSAAHQRAGIMSNRLFEGLAAGALVIANRHPFVEKNFKDLVHVVDDSLPPSVVLSQITDIVEHARRHPAEANEMATRAQEHFLESFSLDYCLSKLVEAHPARVAVVSSPLEVSVDAVVSFTSLHLSRLASLMVSLSRQDHPLQHVTLVIDSKWYEGNKASIDEVILESALAVTILPANLFEHANDLSRAAWRIGPAGAAVFEALKRSSATCFLIMQPEDEIFHGHVRSLVKAISAHPERLMAASGVLIEGRRPDMRFERRLEYLTPKAEHLIAANQSRYSASNLYRRRILDHVSQYAFQLMDGQEHNLLNHMAFVEGAISLSNEPTYVFLEHEEARALAPFVPVEHQHQYARDTQRAHLQQLAFLRATPLPQVVFASPIGTPISWDTYKSAQDKAILIDLGRRYELKAKSEGLRFLSKGFYGAEDSCVWMEGKFGELEFAIANEQRAKARKGRYVLKLELEGRNEPETKKRQFLNVVANGFPIGATAVDARWAEYKFEFGPEILEGSSNVKLRLLLNHAAPISIDGQIVDGRQLGLTIRALTLV